MSELSADQLRAVRHKLDAREHELQGEVRQAKQTEAERPSASERPVEESVEAGERRFRIGMEHAELQRDQQELNAIAETRERMASGHYGECIDCGRPIAYARLQAQPTAVRCIACQTAWERTHGTTPRFSV
jgi:RNA polymerase-binding transcription factor DksA